MAQSHRTNLETLFARDARERAVSGLIRLRVWAAPLMASVALTFAYFEPTAWRRVLLCCVVAWLIALTSVEAIRFRRRGITELSAPINAFGMVAALVGIVTATGGLFSPAIPAFMVGTAINGFVLGRNIVAGVVAIFFVPAVIAFAIVHTTAWPVPTLFPVVFGEMGDFEHGSMPWILAGVYVFMMLALARIAIALRGTFQDVFAEAVEERDRTLALHEEQSRALTTLTAEIAHELKNPLTSVKGLAALLAKDAEGKPAERLAVLRREVDRMQGVLEEFLNFSRPLVPLSISEEDLAQLAREVVRLHEGMASDRAIALRVEAVDRVWLGCDPRKVRQMLINLVQNALDASSDGGEVIVRVRRSDTGDAELSVLDRGPGIDEEIADRIFDAGVTTKEHGSGLGLAVARSLARQHGGELTLSDRDGGGCEARLTLPLEPKEART